MLDNVCQLVPVVFFFSSIFSLFVFFVYEEIDRIVAGSLL